MISNFQINDRIGAATAMHLAPKLSGAEKRLLNRELSLVEFFRRVLDEVVEPGNPLLERLRFLTIFASIVDEFFMVRVAGLKEEVEQGWMSPSPDGMTAEDQLRELMIRLRPMIAEQSRVLKDEILPELQAEGIVVASYHSLSPGERERIDDYFTQNILPVLTPLAVDPAHPFPYISA